MDFVPQLVHAVEAAVRIGINPRDVIAVVGKLFAGSEAGRLADNLVALNHQLRAIGVQHHPFPAEERNRPVGAIANRDKVYERMGLVHRQADAAMMVAQLVEAGGQPGNFMGIWHGE